MISYKIEEPLLEWLTLYKCQYLGFSSSYECQCLPNSEVRRGLKVEIEIYILSAEVDTRNFKPKRNPVKLGMLVSVKNEQ